MADVHCGETSDAYRGTMTDIEDLLGTTPVAALERLIAGGQLSAEELTRAALHKAERLNPKLNAFSDMHPDEAIAAARALDADRARTGTARGPLHGIPIAIKDENDVAGYVTGYGGAAFTQPAARDSAVVGRLREAGAVIIGKTRMPEFGIWPWTESSANGYTRNPWNPLRSTAGSSGGSAAAVAAGIVPFAIGGDGGGSIRLPSSFCGLFGLKCQRGRVTASPNANLWQSLGVIGPLARFVADSALAYDVIAGSLPSDPWPAPPLTRPLLDAVHSATRDTPADAPAPRLRIAVSAKNPTGGPAADRETLDALRATADALASLGHHVEHVDPKYPAITYEFLTQTAAGVAEEASRADQPRLLESRTRRLLALTRPLRPLNASAIRRGIAMGQEFDRTFFDEYDLLLTPTTPTPAVPVGQLDGCGAIAASIKAVGTSSYTAIWNVLGNPAAAVPSGFSRGGLPLSAQIIAPQNREDRILAVAAQLEQARPWADRRPEL